MTESMIHRALGLLDYCDQPSAQATLVESGADPAEAFLAVKAASLLARYMQELE